MTLWEGVSVRGSFFGGQKRRRRTTYAVYPALFLHWPYYLVKFRLRAIIVVIFLFFILHWFFFRFLRMGGDEDWFWFRPSHIKNGTEIGTIQDELLLRVPAVRILVLQSSGSLWTGQRHNQKGTTEFISSSVSSFFLLNVSTREVVKLTNLFVPTGYSGQNVSQ